MDKTDIRRTHSTPRGMFLLAAVCIALFITSCGKRAEPAPKPQPPPPFEFLDAWGNKGDDAGQLDAPVAMTVDTLGRVLFADPAAGFVDKFESTGTPLLSFEDPRLHHASGIAVDSGGAIYVADAARGSVLVFFPDGTFLKATQIPSQPHFTGPLGISVDDGGDLYVPDPARSRIAKFDAHGHLVKSWPAPNDASKNPSPDEKPSGVAVAQDDSVFVEYTGTGRIEKYSSDGEWITSWIATDGLSENSPALYAFAVSGQFVYALAGSPLQIRVWTLDGQHKLDADLGEHLGTIVTPQIAVTPHAELLVLDPSAPRVFRFRIHLDAEGFK
jgi:sugar lactone lactonase YvrE